MTYSDVELQRFRALMNEHGTRTGLHRDMQNVHDICVRRGARCLSQSSHNQHTYARAVAEDDWQRVHELAATHGAVCSPQTPAPFTQDLPADSAQLERLISLRLSAGVICKKAYNDGLASAMGNSRPHSRTTTADRCCGSERHSRHSIALVVVLRVRLAGMPRPCH